jgi:Integrase core domain
MVRPACLATRRFRVLVVVDDFTRERLAAVADTSISSTQVARELDALVARRRAPTTIVSDNGPELTSRAILAWTNRVGLDWHYIAPGKPQQTRDRRVAAQNQGDSHFSLNITGRASVPTGADRAFAPARTRSARSRMPGLWPARSHRRVRHKQSRFPVCLPAIVSKLDAPGLPAAAEGCKLEDQRPASVERRADE